MVRVQVCLVLTLRALFGQPRVFSFATPTLASLAAWGSHGGMLISVTGWRVWRCALPESTFEPDAIFELRTSATRSNRVLAVLAGLSPRAFAFANFHATVQTGLFLPT